MNFENKNFEMFNWEPQKSFVNTSLIVNFRAFDIFSKFCIILYFPNSDYSNIFA